MGCDIHEMIEVKKDSWWKNAGEADIGRNYNIFAVIGNVRNYDKVPYIGEDRLCTEEALDEHNITHVFRDWMEKWGSDAHSASFVTLAEMKAYDAEATTDCDDLVLSRDENGNITSTCAATTGPHLGKVGRCNVFGPFGNKWWYKLIEHMEKVKDLWEITSDDCIRLVFFFDN